MVLVEFDYLVTKDKIEDGENFKDFLNPVVSKFSGVGQSAVKTPPKTGRNFELKREYSSGQDIYFLMKNICLSSSRSKCLVGNTGYVHTKDESQSGHRPFCGGPPFSREGPAANPSIFLIRFN